MYVLVITGISGRVEILRKITADYVVLYVGTVLFPPPSSPVAKPHLKKKKKLKVISSAVQENRESSVFSLF